MALNRIPTDMIEDRASGQKLSDRLAQGLIFTPISASAATNGQLFVDSADDKLKFKNSAGVVNLLY